MSWPRTASELQWWFGLTGVEATDRKLLEGWQIEADSDAYLLTESDLPVAYGGQPRSYTWMRPG